MDNLDIEIELLFKIKTMLGMMVCQGYLFVNEFLVSEETVVLRRWGRSKQKIGFIKRVDKG